ncbi:MAG: YkgJ family cysteine cluster protein [Candidatus Aenigmatarchaeota archaeon]
MSISKELQKEIIEELERERFWIQPFPIITEDVKFPSDSFSHSECKNCEGNCCFFEHSEEFLGVPYNTEQFKKYYKKEFEILENNLKNMVEIPPQPIIGPEEPWLVGNKNWYRIFYDREKDKYSIGYACPVLNTYGRCAIYPKRPEKCKDNIYNKCHLEVVKEFKVEDNGSKSY